MAKRYLYARLYPRNPEAGYPVGGFSWRGQQYRGGPKPIWYKVEERLADELRGFKQEPPNPRSAPLFQVVTEEEFRHIDRLEYEQYMVKMGAMQPVVSVTPAMEAAARSRQQDLTEQPPAPPPPEPPQPVEAPSMQMSPREPMPAVLQSEPDSTPDAPNEPDETDNTPSRARRRRPASGRASALPPPRQPTTSETSTGSAISTADLGKESKKPDGGKNG